MAFFRSVATVGLLTLLSRLLGFVRDLLTATMLGAGPVADAFVVAQRIPNAFRAVFAEGAMDTAFVPIYAHKRRVEPPKTTAEFVNHIFTILVLILLPLTVIAVVFMPAVIDVIAPGFSDDPMRFHLAVTYSRIAFGFLFLISLSALQGSLLNACGHFMPLAAAPAILNVVMIGGFVVAVVFDLDIGLCGSWSMIVGGIVQLLVLQVSCWHYGLTLRFARPRLTADVRKFFKLVGPGVIGVGAVQVNMLVITMLASTLPAGAIAALYYADRLNQLPLGVIGGALSTTLLPALTHHLAAKEDASVISHFSRGLEIGLALCLPSCAVLLLEPSIIVRILFQHGVFNAENAKVTAETISAYSLVIPCGILARVFTTRYFAHQDTKTPVIMGVVSMVLNATLGYIFRGYWQHVGIALGLALTAVIYVGLLWIVLHRRGHAKIDKVSRKRVPRIVLATLLMGTVLWFAVPISEQFSSYIFQHPLPKDILTLSLALLASGGCYLGVLYVSGAMRLADLKSFRKRS